MSPSTSRIAALNDLLRATFLGGRVLMTCGVLSLPAACREAVITKVRAFRDFTPDNDPYGEHDFGAIEHQGVRIFWKIDYFDPDMQFASEDPADPQKTRRVLTILLAEEY